MGILSIQNYRNKNFKIWLLSPHCSKAIHFLLYNSVSLQIIWLLLLFQKMRGERRRQEPECLLRYFTKLRSSLVPRDSPQKWLDWVPQGAGFVHLLSIPVSGRNNNSLFQMKQLWKKKFCAKKKYSVRKPSSTSN